jgi:hypothetical protein
MMTTYRRETVWVNRLALAAGLLAVAGLAGCGGDPEASAEPQPAASPRTSATPSSILRTMPDGNTGDEGAHVPIEAGTYLMPSSAWSVADFTVTFPEGWTVQYGHVFAQHSDEDDEFGFYGVVVDDIFADACRGEGGRSKAVEPGVEDLVNALLKQGGGAVKTVPVSTTLGGYPAMRIDLKIPKHLDLDNCQMTQYGFPGLQVWYSDPADKYFVLLPGAAASVYVVDVGGERQVFLSQVGNPRSAGDRAELQTVLDSIRIEGWRTPS